jgi:NAD(P)H-dependent FMN reductase
LANIAVLVGSVRRDRKGISVVRWIEKKLQERNHKVYFVDPMEIDLPLLDRMYKEMDNPSQKLVELQNRIKDAKGVFQ